MHDPLTENERRFISRMAVEQVIWLTTVSANGTPQPRLVWFIRDGEDIIVYSQPDAWKVRHIRRNPNVALHFNSDPEGSDFQVLIGEAFIDEDAPLVLQAPRYLEKYREGIYGIDMTEESYSDTFRTAIRIRPKFVRGLEPI